MGHDTANNRWTYIDTSQSVTISSGQTASSVIDLEDKALLGFIMPAAFTGSTIAIHASSTSGGTFVACYDHDNTAISFTVSTSRAYDLTQGGSAIGGFRYIKLVSGSSEGADRTIPIVIGR